MILHKVQQIIIRKMKLTIQHADTIVLLWRFVRRGIDTYQKLGAIIEGYDPNLVIHEEFNDFIEAERWMCIRSLLANHLKYTYDRGELNARATSCELIWMASACINAKTSCYHWSVAISCCWTLTRESNMMTRSFHSQNHWIHLYYHLDKEYNNHQRYYCSSRNTEPILLQIRSFCISMYTRSVDAFSISSSHTSFPE